MPATRFIGLTQEAQRKVSKLKQRPSRDRFVMGYDCDHIYMLDFVDSAGKVLFKEVFQMKIWIDGPVFLTCLTKARKLINRWEFSDDLEEHVAVSYENGLVSSIFNTEKDNPKEIEQ